MGFIKDAKVNKVAADAQRAMQEGRTVFLCRINVGMTDAGASGSVPAGAEMIEGVESLGWRLDQMSYTRDRKGAPEGYYLFRRAPQQAYQQQPAQSGYRPSGGYQQHR